MCWACIWHFNHSFIVRVYLKKKEDFFYNRILLLLEVFYLFVIIIAIVTPQRWTELLLENGILNEVINIHKFLDKMLDNLDRIGIYGGVSSSDKILERRWLYISTCEPSMSNLMLLSWFIVFFLRSHSSIL